MSPFNESAPLDNLMLLCIECFDAEAWPSDVFGVLGTGEEYLDKTFADVRSTVDNKPIPALVY